MFTAPLPFGQACIIPHNHGFGRNVLLPVGLAFLPDLLPLFFLSPGLGLLFRFPNGIEQVLGVLPAHLPRFGQGRGLLLFVLVPGLLACLLPAFVIRAFGSLLRFLAVFALVFLFVLLFCLSPPGLMLGRLS